MSDIKTPATSAPSTQSTTSKTTTTTTTPSTARPSTSRPTTSRPPYRPGGGRPGGRPGGGRPGARPGGRRNFRPYSKKVCRYCKKNAAKIDYKDAKVLRPFLTERGKILPRRMSGNCAKHQRKVNIAIKRARILAIIPYTALALDR